MTRLAILVVLSTAVAADLAAQAATPRPVVRAHLEPAGKVNVGETVDLVIDILVPTWFPTAPALPAIEVPNTLASLSDDTQNLSERIGGEWWAGIRRRYRMIVQAPGTIQVPPVAVVIVYAIDARPSAPLTLTTPALSFEAGRPPGAEELDYFFASSSLRLTERFDRKVERLKVGEGFTRRVTLSAEADSAIALPPLNLEAPAGISLQVDPPETTVTRGDRGAANTVSRVERATYIARKEGHYSVPAVDIAFWDTAAKRVRHATLPAISIEVDSAPAFTSEITLPPDPDAQTAAAPSERSRNARRNVWPYGLAVLGAVAAFWWLIWRYGHRLRSRWVAARRRRAESEAHYFDEVQRAARKGDGHALVAAAMAWLARFEPTHDLPTFECLADRAGDPILARWAHELERSLYRQGTVPIHKASIHDLETRMAHARARLQAVSTPSASPPGRELLPLNPPS